MSLAHTLPYSYDDDRISELTKMRKEKINFNDATKEDAKPSSNNSAIKLSLKSLISMSGI